VTITAIVLVASNMTGAKLYRIEGELLIDRGIGAERGRGAKQRIAVGRGFRDEVGSYVARSARAVVGDDADLPAFGEFRSQDPREDVGARARSIGNHDLDRPCGPHTCILRERSGRPEAQSQSQRLRGTTACPLMR